MEKEQGLGVLCRVLDEREEVVVDRERNVCDPVLSVGSVLVSKEHLWKYNCKGMIFLMFAVLSHIILQLNKPYHFPNLLSGA